MEPNELRYDFEREGRRISEEKIAPLSAITKGATIAKIEQPDEGLVLIRLTDGRTLALGSGAQGGEEGWIDVEVQIGVDEHPPYEFGSGHHVRMQLPGGHTIGIEDIERRRLGL